MSEFLTLGYEFQAPPTLPTVNVREEWWLGGPQSRSEHHARGKHHRWKGLACIQFQTQVEARYGWPRITADILAKRPAAAGGNVYMHEMKHELFTLTTHAHTRTHTRTHYTRTHVHTQKTAEDLATSGILSPHHLSIKTSRLKKDETEWL
jgi:hypothetical protein